MNGTPRLRSSYPSTPGSTRRSPGSGEREKDGAPKLRTSLPNLPNNPSTETSTNPPVIPVTLIDAPSQRMYAVGLYILLFAWRIFDWFKLIEEDATSVSLFVKWSFIDLLFLFGLPLLRIPWLEWSDTTSVIACLLHAGLNGMLMFRIPLPIEGWFMVLMKTMFDREMSLSENSVRPNSILHNSSLIMGRQIINILPKGSATMNPDSLPFCVNQKHPSVNIPLYFNQTKPTHVELLRIDFETNINETIVLTAKEVKNARKAQDDDDDALLVIDYVAKKPGLYRLHKILDQTKLEVQRRMSDTLVVTCPRANVKSATSDKCLGDLSDLTMEIEGIPPLKIRYSRTVNAEQSLHHFPGIAPESFESPLLGATRPSTLVTADSEDVSWAQTQRISVPLNESMVPSGRWLYSIDQIHDAIGNVANFSTGGDNGEHVYPKGTHLEQDFIVHERPVARLTGCDSRNPLAVAKGNPKQLPAEYTSPGRTPDDTSHTLYWKFSPLDTLTKSGDHGSEVIFEEYSAKNSHDTPKIREPGLYTLVGVKSNFCEGRIKEPASCLLLNPPEPDLAINAKPINDRCAGSSVGLMVDLELIGTPPFVVRYNIITKDGTQPRQFRVDGLRHQLELKPRDAGHFKYQFTSVDDSVYKGYSLGGKNLVLEQDVKPLASAYLRPPPTTIDACIEEPIEMNIELSGEAPFNLQYELGHGGKRTKFDIPNITSNVYRIKTEPLTKGGEYFLAVTSVQDKTGCKIPLESTVNFSVRRQRPKVAFGELEGKHKTVEVEGRGIDLPLRLTGRAPWRFTYRNLNDTSGKIMEKVARATNDILTVKEGGIYEILDISDEQCPGTVDPTASRFEIDWLPRPQIKLSQTAVLIPDGEKYVKREVCEGDVDAIEVNLFGHAPYHVKYKVLQKPDRGASFTSYKEFEAALGSATVPMDTSKPGVYEYKFSELSDALYDHNSQKFTPLVLEQKVNRKPAAHFVKPGQSYNYCKSDMAGDDVIPIELEGVPPFSLEVDIKHQSNSRPETLSIANVDSNHYDFQIPHKYLSLGNHQVSVRKVRDAHGCQQKTEYGAPHVQVKVYDVPTIHPLESRTDYCVGERIAYSLSGTSPFEIYYSFDSQKRKAKSTVTTFRRIAEKPGNFTITAVADGASECKASTNISKIVHEMPSVKISKGRQVEVDIHEGGEAEILFEFWGTPPFEFTYTRSTNARKGQKSQVLETRHEVSYEYSKIIQSSQEGTYEVVAIKDKFCSFSRQQAEMETKQKVIQMF